jgi:hypothetical protein
MCQYKLIVLLNFYYVFIPRQWDDIPLNCAGRAIKKSAIVRVGLAAA